jgi:putative restriction endonuclease
MVASAQCENWLKVVANLRVDRKNGNIAPHKPLLLLVLAELAEQGNLREPLLWLTGELVFRFLAFWTIVAGRRSQRPEITLPFYHLHSDGFWEPLDEIGKPTLERRRTVAAKLDEGFLACLSDTRFRESMRRVLIARYFVDRGERAALYSLVGLPVPPDDLVKADARLFAVARERGREARFRLTVVPAYNYTCALTGYRLTTVGSGSIVDAAHIHQFSDSRNNHPQNGIALCKNAHWLFDQGLWSLTDDYEVIVAFARFDEAGPDAFLLRRSAGKQIELPAIRSYWPDRNHLAWHRKHKFQGR